MVNFAKTIESLTKNLPFGLGGKAKEPKEEENEKADAVSQDGKTESPPEQGGGDIEIGVVQEPMLDNAQLEDLKKQIALSTERVSELETRLYKAEKAVDTAQKESETLKGRMDQNDSRILDMLSVYEVVSNQINPFVGSSKVLSSTIEQLQEELSVVKNQVSTMSSDLKILCRGKVDITRLVRTSITDADQKRRVDLTKLIRTAVQSKKTVRAKKGNDLEFGP